MNGVERVGEVRRIAFRRKIKIIYVFAHGSVQGTPIMNIPSKWSSVKRKREGERITVCGETQIVCLPPPASAQRSHVRTIWFKYLVSLENVTPSMHRKL